MVRQIRRNRGFSTANLAQATDTPGGMWPWVGNRPRNAGSRRWSIPTTPGTTTHPEGAAASKELDGGLRPSARGSGRERGNCDGPASPPLVVADLASGDRTSQDRGFVVVAGVTSGHGDGNAVTGRREPARSQCQRCKGEPWIRHEFRIARKQCNSIIVLWYRVESPVDRKGARRVRASGSGSRATGKPLGSAASDWYITLYNQAVDPMKCGR